MVGIYKITSPSNRVYIGQSININRRFIEYGKSDCSAQVRLYYSFNKYGVDNHKFEVIETCAENKLNERERYWQDYYDVLSNGLNCKLTDTKDRSGELSDETKAKIGKAHKGKIMSENTKKLLSEINKGKTIPKKTRNKISNTLKGRIMTDSHRRKKSLAQVGGKNHQAKLTLNTATGIYYDSLSEAAYFNCINYRRLKNWCSGRLRNKSSIIYV